MHDHAGPWWEMRILIGSDDDDDGGGGGEGDGDGDDGDDGDFETHMQHE